jgi:hypothetical protein
MPHSTEYHKMAHCGLGYTFIDVKFPQFTTIEAFFTGNFPALKKPKLSTCVQRDQGPQTNCELKTAHSHQDRK